MRGFKWIVDMMTQLLSEMNSEEIVYDDGNKNYTVAEMLKEIENETELGLGWAASISDISKEFMNQVTME